MAQKGTVENLPVPENAVESNPSVRTKSETGTLIWVDKAAAIDHQYAIYPNSKHQNDGKVSRDSNVLSSYKNGQSCESETHSEYISLEQQQPSPYTDINNEGRTLNVPPSVTVSVAEQDCASKNIIVVSRDGATESDGNEHVNEHKTSKINTTPKVQYARSSETDFGVAKGKDSMESNKPAYRTLVQRRSVFDGINLKVTEENKSVSEDLERVNSLKCGYCSEMYSDKDAMVSHLLTHNASSRTPTADKSYSPRRKKRCVTSKKRSTDARCSGQEQYKSSLKSAQAVAANESGNTEENKIRKNPKADKRICDEVIQETICTNPSFVEGDDSKEDMNRDVESYDAPAITSGRKKRHSHKNTNQENKARMHTMASVGKRNAKKSLSDDFITFEPRRKRTVNKIGADLKLTDPETANTNEVAKRSVNRAKSDVRKKVNPNTNQPHENRENVPHLTVFSLEKKQSSGSEDPLTNADKLVKLQGTALDSSAKVSNVTSKTLLQCVTCKGCFLWKWPFLNHLKVHPNEKPYECLVCQKRLFSFFSYLSHVKYFHSSKNGYQCLKCDSVFRSKYLLKRHVNNSHKDLDSKTSCDKCDQTFSHRHLLSKHNKEVHQRLVKEQEMPIRCKPCGKTFQDRRNLWIHQKRHPNAVKPYRCQFCSRRFAMQKWLKDHIQRHTPIRNFPCGICGKRYFTKSDATMHERRHTKEAAFACTECDRKFIYNSELKAHLRRHQGIKLPKNIVCEVCMKPFATRRDLERHMTVHTGVKPYKCHVCDKGFSQEVNMQVHMRIHSGERPYQCDLCEKKFIAKSKLKRHRQCHSTPKGMLPRPYKCVLCPRKYTAENSLIRHLRTHKDSPETITNITNALNKAAEEPNMTESATSAGAVLACMIDQAISDARRMTRRRKKVRRTDSDDPTLAEIIDQAIHNSKASCSTQTPIVIENFNNTYVNIQLPTSDLKENVSSPDDYKNKGSITVSSDNNGETASCGDLIKLISEALIKHNETDQVSQPGSSHQPAFTTETIIVEPKAEVINSGASCSNKEISPSPQLSTSQVPPLRGLTSVPDNSGTYQTVPIYQEMQVSSASDDVQHVYVHTLNFPAESATSPTQQEIIVAPVAEPVSLAQQYITLSHNTSEPFVVQPLLTSPDNSGQQNVLSSVMRENNTDIAQVSADETVLNATAPPTSPKHLQQIFPSQSSIYLDKCESAMSLLPGGDMKNEGSTLLQPENPKTCPNKMRHIIVKTAGGQTFLIPSTLISMDESSQILMTTLSAAPPDVGNTSSALAESNCQKITFEET